MLPIISIHIQSGAGIVSGVTQGSSASFLTRAGRPDAQSQSSLLPSLWSWSESRRNSKLALEGQLTLLQTLTPHSLNQSMTAGTTGKQEQQAFKEIKLSVTYSETCKIINILNF